MTHSILKSVINLINWVI